MTMNRLIAPVLAAILAVAFAAPVRAAPVNSSTACALLYQTQAQKMAVANNVSYPFAWLRRVWTKTDVIFDLKIFWPTGAQLYHGYHCHIRPNGTIVADTVPVPRTTQ